MTYFERLRDERHSRRGAVSQQPIGAGRFRSADPRFCGKPVVREVSGSTMYVPKQIFFTKGVGTHREKLTSFELALRDAQIACYNLVRVSSIFPPHCEEVSIED